MDVLSAEPAVLTGGLVGYARVSTSAQLLDRQIRALAEAGCVRVFADKKSGRDAERPEPTACLAFLRPGDVLVVPDDPAGLVERRHCSRRQPHDVAVQWLTARGWRRYTECEWRCGGHGDRI